jgi:hypothetical protein
MIHHVSLPALEPARVAGVLSELLEGRVYPFAGAGGYLVVSGDADGTAIEVVAADVALVPGDGERQVRFERGAVLEGAHPFHMLLSVPVGREVVEAVGAREGWRTRHFWRGSQAHPRDFELIELWLENRTMLEVLTPEMVAGYRAHMQFEVLERRGCRSGGCGARSR